VFIRNRVSGTTERISVRSDGSQPQYNPPGNNNDSRAPTVNDAGTVVAFESTNRNLAPETNPVPGDTWQTYDIYVRDISDPNALNHTTERITVGLGDVKANGSSSTPIVSSGGRYVWFSSAASNLTAGDTNGRVDLFVHDRQTAITTRLDVTGATGLPLDGDAFLADVSPDGRWVAFSSNASTIVASDTNGQSDAFLLDTASSTVKLASPALAPLANGPSFASSVSDDGQHVFFQSQATNLVPDDTNGKSDVFVSNMMTRATQRISLDIAGGQRNGASSAASATADGNTVVYMFQGVGEGFFSIWRSELELP
jgi:WD40-like Beta Propeller Repeat